MLRHEVRSQRFKPFKVIVPQNQAAWNQAAVHCVFCAFSRLITYSPDPECSGEALKAKIEGAVVLTVVVGTDGLAHDVSVVKTVGYGLDEEAIKAVKKWRFKPATSLGNPAPAQVGVQINFRCELL